MKDFDPRSLIRPDLLDLPGYVPIEPTGVLARRLGIDPDSVIKLDGNENPYGPSPKALEAIRNESAYHIYPDPDQRAAREAIARYLNADGERAPSPATRNVAQPPSPATGNVAQPPSPASADGGRAPSPASVRVDQIVCGLGSDDLIDLILRAVISPGDAVINCPPTFGMYPFSTEIAGGRVIEVPRQESFSLDIAAVEKAAPEAKAIFLASPNNPTGNLLSTQEIERLLALPLLVVIDEAYIEFAGASTTRRDHSSVALVSSNPNLVVLRTFSKWAGLAGLRAGYGVMSAALAAVLMTIKQPYNLNVAASTAIVAAVDDQALLDERARKITGARERMMDALAAIPWLTPYPSDANFILCRLDGLDAVEVKDRLAKRGIFVRYFDTPALRNHLRISVGLEEHVAIVASALREIGAELGR